MNKPVLIVVDMQSNFFAAKNKKTISSCQELIQNAMDNLYPIIFLEFKYNGATLPSLTNMTNNYPYKFFVEKDIDDGSEYVKDYFAKCKVTPKDLIVCGVNTNMCVLATVLGLASQYSISVVRNACNTNAGDAEAAFQRMLRWGVKLI